MIPPRSGETEGGALLLLRYFPVENWQITIDRKVSRRPVRNKVTKSCTEQSLPKAPAAPLRAPISQPQPPSALRRASTVQLKAQFAQLKAAVALLKAPLALPRAPLPQPEPRLSHLRPPRGWRSKLRLRCRKLRSRRSKLRLRSSVLRYRSPKLHGILPHTSTRAALPSDRAPQSSTFRAHSCIHAPRSTTPPPPTGDTAPFRGDGY